MLFFVERYIFNLGTKQKSNLVICSHSEEKAGITGFSENRCYSPIVLVLKALKNKYFGQMTSILNADFRTCSCAKSDFAVCARHVAGCLRYSGE